MNPEQAASAASTDNFWYPREDLNLWPFGPQPNALSAELRGRVLVRSNQLSVNSRFEIDLC